MALVKCRECGREISSEAKKCPHCGKDTTPPSVRVLTALFTLAIVVAGAYYLHIEKYLPPGAVRSWISSLFGRPDPKKEAANPANFISDQFADVWWSKLDPHSPLTKVQRDEYFQRNLRGKWVRWTGILDEVEVSGFEPKATFLYEQGFFREAKVIVRFLPEYDRQLRSLNKGEEVTYVGRIDSFDSWGLFLVDGQVVTP